MTASLPSMIRFQPLVAGAPIPGGKVYFYAAGTTTPQAAYADDGTTPLTNPLTLDANGATDFRLGTGLSYKIDLTLADGVTPVAGWPKDNILGSDGVLSALAASGGSSLVGFIQSGAGAVPRTEQDKSREWVSVLDYGADPTGVADSTAAFTSAQAASDHIRIPAGTYLLDNFKQQNRKVFRGDGRNNTFIKQASTGNPAWWCVSKAGVYETQIIGAELTGVWFIGKAGATVASCIVEAISPYVVAYSHFDFGGNAGFHTLEVKAGSAFEVYSCTFKIYQDDPSGGVGSTDTGVVCGPGVYNEWYLNIAKANNGIAFTSYDWGAVFHHCVSEGAQIYLGTHNTILAPTVESWYGSAAANGAIQVLGPNNRVIGAALTNVPSAKCGDTGITLNSGGGNNSTILGYKVFGTYPLTAPIYPFSISAGDTGTIADAQTAGCQYKLNDYLADSILKNFTFLGDCTELVSNYLSPNILSGTFTPVLAFGGGSTGVAYTVQQANYQRVGGYVAFDITINLSAKGSSTGAATITGLPIASKTQANHYTPITISTDNVTIPAGYVIATVGSNATSISLAYAVSGGGNTSLSDTQFANNSNLRLCGMYPV